MDVLEVAKTRRSALAKEIAKLDEFIALGEELSKSGALAPSQGRREQTSSAPTPSKEAREEASSGAADDEREPMPLRQFAARN